MENKLSSEKVYFNPEMNQEFHVAFAKREASRIVKHIEYQKKVVILEKHLTSKYSTIIVGS